MRNLLSANLHRLRKSKVFWGCETVTALYALFLSWGLYMERKIDEITNPLDAGLFQYTVFFGIVLAVFCSLYLGPELGDGTVRNKVVTGHRKSHIYLANLLACTIAALCMSLTHLAIYLATSLPCPKPLEADMSTVAGILVSSMALALAYCAIFTLIAMTVSNKAVISTACILLAFILFFMGIAIRQRLDEPESFEIVDYDQETKEAVYTGQVMANGKYLPASKRMVYEFLNDFLPGGQGLQLSGMMMSELTFDWVLPLYSLAIALCSMGAGVVIFVKKDIN